MSWYWSHYRAVKWVQSETQQGQLDRHQGKQICDFIPLCYIQWKFKPCCHRAQWRVLTPAFKGLARLADTWWPLQMVAGRLSYAQLCRSSINQHWKIGSEGFSDLEGSSSVVYLVWAWQVSRLCAVPLVLLDVRIIWHAFKRRKWPRQSCSFIWRI